MASKVSHVLEHILIHIPSNIYPIIYLVGTDYGLNIISGVHPSLSKGNSLDGIISLTTALQP